MENITSTTDLKNAILLLETDLHVKGLELQEQFSNINPLNLISETLKGDDSSPGILENIVVGGVSLATGYLTRKIFVGSSGNVFRKLIGTALQFGATSVVTQNSNILKAFGKFILNKHSASKGKKKPNRE